ncbi:MAG: transporter permease, partial [Microvirga sp.]|nr:transporter permease [Microvirga sp.]
MAGFILKRLLQAIFVVLAVTLIVAFAIRLSGDPAIMMLGGGGNVTEQDLQ